ncbi:Methyltransferase family protein [Carbonactinospora thermoautotrophica]|uniref:Methyltransferase family protein n=1 Tax=Carbonactinospora thermoautotrophica TaxID=1469144 RepID=A0A132MZF1_9ACTN|nr:class I SAM-dependent methyltransferase [Carbonactinospora thermoautotrophica]KWX03193.1 Methyltransferase family protein [Carbonactinospora thermoautotrophica]KWX03268.1 Methyltransferase family protein [Carbonactinospora thermoautotrophica]
MSVTAVEAWERYTQGRRPRRAVNAFGATTWLNWTQYEDHGPNEAILGDVRGRRVLELGSGSGCNLAHLATLGADCVGVDLAPTQTAKARRRWGHLSNLRFHTGDAVDFLAGTGERFDVVYSIFGATWFVDPDVLLPLVWRRLTPGGVLAFSHLPPADAPPRRPGALPRYDYEPDEWAKLLDGHGFVEIGYEIIDPPRGATARTLLVHARRPDAV